MTEAGKEGKRMRKRNEEGRKKKLKDENLPSTYK
tara:strand:- start:247 stop:348 length:102 start_codon:yes stop_codon:yes gene_type:complete